MKRLFYLLTFLIALSSSAWAQYAPVWRLEEVDGSPQVINPTVVKVSNGTLSCTGRVCTITTGGGGGGSPGGSNTQLQYNNAGAFGGVTGATSDGTTVTLTSPTINTGITLNAAPLTMSGNISSAAWTTNGIRIKGVAATLTDTTSSGTVATAYTNNLGGNTIAASSSTTFTDYYSNFMTGPTAGTNVTFTRSWALGLSGNLSVAGTIVQTSASATAFESGPNGSTNPVFRLVNNVASAATGLSITGNAAGSGVDLTVLSSGSNENLNITAKGTGRSVFPARGINIGTAGWYEDGTGTLVATGGGTGTSEGANVNALRVRALSGGTVLATLDNGSGGLAGVASGGRIGFSSAATNATSIDTSLVRSSASVFRVGDGSTGAGSLIIGTSAGAIGTSGAGVLAFTLSTAPTTSPTDTVQLYSVDSAAGDHNLTSRNEAGEINRLTGLAARNSSAFAKTTDTTLADITGLSRNVEASRVYAFRAYIQTTSGSTGGVKFSVSGTAAATSVNYEGVLRSDSDDNIVNIVRATALDTVVCNASSITSSTCEINGTIVVNAAGTLTIQFAQNTSDGSASTVLANQYLQLIPIS